MGQIIFKLFVGAIAGLIAWAVWEPSAPPLGDASAWTRYENYLILTLGFLVGSSLGGVSGWMQGSRRHTLKGVLVGGILGMIGASIGFAFGAGIVQATFGDAIFESNSPVRIIARAIALTPIGTFLGAAIGASSPSVKRILTGAIGGTLGGLAGGLTFDIVSSVLGGLMLAAKGTNPGTSAEIGAPGRALTCLLIGGGVGLFVGIVERIARTAWLRLSLGRNEGKEWVVDAPQTFIGRSEGAQVPLFGDMSVAPMHACIVKQGQTFTLMDGGGPGGTRLNGVPIQSASLFHGAQIGIGSFNLEFLMKVGSAPQRAAEQVRAQSAAQYQMSGQAAIAIPSPMPSAPQPTQAYAQSPVSTSVGPSTLVAMSGPVSGQQFSVLQPIEIGREGSGIAIGFDTMASRRHASIAPQAGGMLVTDLGSTNGTFVNGQRIQTIIAKAGDIIRIGMTDFRVQ